MVTKRFMVLAVTIVVMSMLLGCQTAQRSGGQASEQPAAAPPAQTEATGGTQMVKGLNGWEGEIVGKPARGSKFTKLQIGMTTDQVIALIGPPTDRFIHSTGKGRIPFYFGSDRTRHEYAYRGHGRLTFAGGSIGSSSRHLISIVHDAGE
jgi:hypothetical protein